MVPSRTPADPQGGRQAPKTGPGELQGAPGTTSGGPRRSMAGLRASPTGDHLQGPPRTPSAGPRPPKPGLCTALAGQGAPGTTRDHHRRSMAGLRAPPPGDHLQGPPGATRRSVGPRVPTFKHPWAGALGLRPAPQAPRGPGDTLDLETFPLAAPPGDQAHRRSPSAHL